MSVTWLCRDKKNVWGIAFIFIDPIYTHLQTTYDKQEEVKASQYKICSVNPARDISFPWTFTFSSIVSLLFHSCGYHTSQFTLEIKDNCVITSELLSGQYSWMNHLAFSFLASWKHPPCEAIPYFPCFVVFAFAVTLLSQLNKLLRFIFVLHWSQRQCVTCGIRTCVSFLLLCRLD